MSRREVQLPSAVELEVTKTDPGLRGDSVSGGGTKPATLETGAVIQVPLFVEEGQRIRVDTRSGEYVARAWMRRSEQRRAAVIALYQHDLTGRPLAEMFGRTTRCSRARSRMRPPIARRSSTR